MDKIFENMAHMLLYMASGRKITLEAPLSKLPTTHHKAKKTFIGIKYNSTNHGK